jgi:hypothetical protein
VKQGYGKSREQGVCFVEVPEKWQTVKNFRLAFFGLMKSSAIAGTDWFVCKTPPKRPKRAGLTPFFCVYHFTYTHFETMEGMGGPETVCF